MSSCRDCIHYDLCRDCSIFGVDDLLINNDCEYFKDKSKFIELPCKVGDKIFVIINNYSDWKSCYDGTIPKNYEIIETEADWGWMGVLLEKSQHRNYLVFLTKEEAEAKLKELEGEQNEKTT